MPGLGDLAGRNIRRGYGYDPGSSGYGYLSRGGSYGYPDTYGARVLPGGYLAASPSQTGQARQIYGVDFPVVGYPSTGYDSNYPLSGSYTDSLGLGSGSRYANLPNVTYPPAYGRIPGGIDITGDMDNPPSSIGGGSLSADIGPGAYRSYVGSGTDTGGGTRYPIPGGGVSTTTPSTSNTPGPLQYLSRINPLFGMIGGMMGGTDSGSSGGTPDWVQNAQSGYGFAGRLRGLARSGVDWLTGMSPNYPDLSSIAGTVYDAAGYPIPGGGDMRNAAGDWRQNAQRSGGGFSGRGNAAGGGPVGASTVAFGYGGTGIGPASGGLFQGQAVEFY